MSQQTLPCTPPLNDRGCVHFFPIEKVDFVGDIRIRTHKNVVLSHNHSNPILTRLTLFDKIE